MINSKAGFLTLLLLLGITQFLTAQIAPNSSLVGKTIYHYAPPLDDPILPFKVVTIDENTPEWAKQLYQPNPNINAITKMHDDWRKANPEVKNGHTRNYRKLYGYLVQNDGINKEGYIQLPTNEELKALNEKILKERAIAKRKQQQSKARNSSNNTTWEHIGPIVKYNYFDNEPINYMVNVYAMAQSTSKDSSIFLA